MVRPAAKRQSEIGQNARRYLGTKRTAPDAAGPFAALTST
jgi:hypothetical protein